MSANEKQVAGNHYAAGGSAQHWDYVLGALFGRYLEGNITKYVVRHRKKNGMQDLQKAMHYLDKLRETYMEGGIRNMLTTRHDAEIKHGPVQFNIHSFSVANGLNVAENNVVHICARWSSLRDLEAIEQLIRELMADEDERVRREQAIKAGALPQA